MIYTVKHTLITWATVGATPSFAVTADNLMFTGHITPTELPAEALLQHALAPIGFGTRPHMVTRVVGDVYCLVLISIVAALFLIDLYYFSPFPLPLLYLLLLWLIFERAWTAQNSSILFFFFGLCV